MNMNVKLETAKGKWMPVIDTIKKTLKEEEEQNMTAEEKICIYAEYHSINEATNLNYINGSTIDLLVNKNIDTSSTLPLSLKILTSFGLNHDLKNIRIIPSPRYELYTGKVITSGDVEFVHPINKNSETLQKNIDDIIYNVMIDFLQKNENKKIYIYLLIQSINIMDNVSDGGSILKWRTRIAFDE